MSTAHQRRRLEAALSERGGARGGLEIGRSGDRADLSQARHAVAVAIHETEAACRDRLAIRAALRRLDDGSYGVCEGCGEPVAPARLDAIPWAALCLPCQQDWDRLGTDHPAEIAI